MAPQISITESELDNVWGGKVVILREMYDTATGETITLEAHETGGDFTDRGEFVAAEFHDGDTLGGTEGTLAEVVRWMLAYPTPAGWTEGPAPASLDECSRENHALLV